MANNRNNPATNHPFEFPSSAITFDPEAFDLALRSQGTRLVHFRSMVCPIGSLEPDDIRRDHVPHEGCSNGFLYTKAGPITAIFTGNSTQSQLIDLGRADGSSVQVTTPRYYDESPDIEMELAQFDRFYLAEESITVVTWEKFAAHVTGQDRLKFPVVSVTDLMDAHGKRYKQGVDFEVRGGQLHWGSNRPGVDPKTQKGVVCSVRYKYRPYYYVRQLLHEVRVAQVEDDYGNRKIIRMPQSMILAREFVFENEQNGDQTEGSPRQHKGPLDSLFGPR